MRHIGLYSIVGSIFLTGCKNSIVGYWTAYSHNKFELPVSNCQRELCNGVQNFTLLVEEDLAGDFRLEVMQDSEYYIYTFPLTAQLTKPNEQQDLWTLMVDNAENEAYPDRWTCWVRGRISDCTIGDDLYQLKRD